MERLAQIHSIEEKDRTPDNLSPLIEDVYNFHVGQKEFPGFVDRWGANRVISKKLIEGIYTSPYLQAAAIIQDPKDSKKLLAVGEMFEHSYLKNVSEITLLAQYGKDDLLYQLALHLVKTGLRKNISKFYFTSDVNHADINNTLLNLDATISDVTKVEIAHRHRFDPIERKMEYLLDLSRVQNNPNLDQL